MVIKEESRLKFGFPEGSKVIKFDDTKYYRDLFNNLPGAKGVDFIAWDGKALSFIEVKNCLGDEGNCRWRIAPNNKKKNTTSTQINISGRNSLDIEVAEKFAMTLAALNGAKSFGERKELLEELQEILNIVFSKKLSDEKIKKFVIIFLEGNFGGHTRTKKMIMAELQRSLNIKLKWFHCRVSVVDSETCDEKLFKIIK